MLTNLPVCSSTQAGQPCPPLGRVWNFEMGHRCTSHTSDMHCRPHSSPASPDQHVSEVPEFAKRWLTAREEFRLRPHWGVWPCIYRYCRKYCHKNFSNSSYTLLTTNPFSLV